MSPTFVFEDASYSYSKYMNHISTIITHLTIDALHFSAFIYKVLTSD